MSIPELTAAIDSLQVRVDALTARLDAIEGKPVSTPARYFRSNYSGIIRRFSELGSHYRYALSAEWIGDPTMAISRITESNGFTEITAAEGEPS